MTRETKGTYTFPITILVYQTLPVNVVGLGYIALETIQITALPQSNPELFHFISEVIQWKSRFKSTHPSLISYTYPQHIPNLAYLFLPNRLSSLSTLRQFYYKHLPPSNDNRLQYEVHLQNHVPRAIDPLWSGRGWRRRS